ncbi:hypothetical protein [Caballeronia sordidicola]
MASRDTRTMVAIGANVNGIGVNGRSVDGTTATTVMAGATNVSGTAKTITIEPVRFDKFFVVLKVSKCAAAFSRQQVIDPSNLK